MIKALELYSGIGGFSKAIEGSNIEVFEAFEQNEHAIKTYKGTSINPSISQRDKKR